MYLSPALKERLRPFAPVLLPLYRFVSHTSDLFQTAANARAQRREDERCSPEILEVMQGFRRAPISFAAKIAQHPDVPADIRQIARIVVRQNLAKDYAPLSKTAIKAAFRLSHWWSREQANVDAIIVLVPVLLVSPLSMLQRLRLRMMARRTFNTTLRTYDVLRAKALLGVIPAAERPSLQKSLDARLPEVIVRSFIPDQGATSLIWMDHFPGSPHQLLRENLVRATAENAPELLRDISFEHLERIILNPRNLSAELDGPYYEFLNMVSSLLPSQVEGRSQERILRIFTLTERKIMRGEILKRDYNAALARARALTRSAGALPEDRYVRIDLMNKLGRSAPVHRYVRWLHSLHARGAAPEAEIALRLWAAWSPQAALDVLGDAQHWTRTEQTAKTALRSLIRLRRFREAAALAPKCMRWPSLFSQAQMAEETQAALQATGLQINIGEDAALRMLSHWLERHRAAPAPAYQPEPRRVLIYSHSLGIGGAERQVTNLISALCEDPEASSVHLLLKERSRRTYRMSQDAARFSLHDFAGLPEELAPPWGDHPLLREVLGLCRPLGLSGIDPVLRAIYQLRPEVVHVRGGLYAEVVLAAVLAGVPKVVVHFGSMTRAQQSNGTELEMLRETLVERTIGLCAEHPQVVLAANSRAAANDWARAAKLPQSRMDVLYNAVDANELNYKAAAPFDRSKRPLVVGGVFRFAPVKGPLLWVEVARRVHEALPGTRFLMVGDGPMRKSVERAIEMAGLTGQFELPGLITSGLFDYLERMDLSLMTTRTESLPNAVIEAQMAGLPVIAPDVGGIGEALAEPGAGRLTERSAEALADAVIEGLRDTEWRADVHQRAPALILDKFSRKRQLESTKAVYGWQK